VVGAAIAVIGYLAVVPLVYLLHDTFTGAQGGFSVEAFTRAYTSSSQAGRMMLNSVGFAVGSAALALGIGTLLAYVQVRTDAPLKGLFFAASLVPLIIPAILYSAAWIFLADPRIGLINVLLLEPVLGRSPLNVFSLPGMVWVQGLHLAPIAFLLMGAAFRSMDPALEEAAMMSGASRRTLLRRITMPLVRPAVVSAVLLLFVQSLESFEVPGLLGLQSGIYVFTSRIYFTLRQFPIDYGAAGAYALGLLAIAVVGVLTSGWLSRNARSFQTVTGRAFRPRPIELGRARPLVGALVVAYFALAVVLPLAVLLYASLLRFYSAPSAQTLRSLSLDNYRKVLHMPLALTALRNSVLLGIGAATTVMLLTAIASWMVVRTRTPGRRLLDVLAFTPLVVPGLVLGLALSFVYLRTSLPVYGTLWILLIAYATRYLPYGMRYSSAAMTQTSGELEESALICGASWWQTVPVVGRPGVVEVDQPAAGRQQRGGLGVEGGQPDPVQVVGGACGGDDPGAVGHAGAGQVGHVAQAELHPPAKARQPLTGLLQHALGDVQPEAAGAREGVQEHRQQGAGAAGHVDDQAGLGVVVGDDRRGHGPRQREQGVGAVTLRPGAREPGIPPDGRPRLLLGHAAPPPGRRRCRSRAT
jgi:iron(III) transport system permease protein